MVEEDYYNMTTEIMSEDTVEQIETAPLLKPYIEWPEPYRSNLSVTIRGETRVPRYAEAVHVPEKVFQQAEEIGLELASLSESLPELIQLPEVRLIGGLSERVYQDKYVPFLGAPHIMDFFGVDAILDINDNIKAIEINTRPQVLGRYDAATPVFLDAADQNARMTPRLKEVLQTRIGEGSIGVVVSHPLNAFHNHHKLFSEQSGFPIVTLQDLHTNEDGDVTFGSQKVDMMFRQFATRNLFQPQVTDPAVLEAIKQGKVNLVNGPLSDFIGEKTLFPYIAELCPGIRKYLPKMELINTGENVDLKQYSGWWLKGETRGQIELVLKLAKQNLQGWPGQVVRDIVAGDTKHAREVLEGKESSTADRLREHVKDIEGSVPEKWILQENIDPKGFIVMGEDGKDSKLYSTLRMYFVKSPTHKDGRPNSYLEFLAGKNARVSAAGYTIPVKGNIPSSFVG